MSHSNIVVFGYNDIGCECLSAVLENHVNVVAVFTYQDKSDSELIWFRSVKELAEAHDIPVCTLA
jgi:methionyl-tRNA formyltransferase